MGWLGGADLLAKQATLEAVFMAAMQNPDPKGVIARLASDITIDTESVVLAWNDLIGTMREWLGDRTIVNLQGRSITVTPRHWERSVGINKDHLQDDKLGLASETMNGLARVVQMDYRRKLVAKLMAGFTDLGCDGKAIFATDHPYVDAITGVAGTIDNLSATNVSTALVDEAILYFDTLVSPDGSELYVEPDVAIVAPAQRAAWEAILLSPTLTGGAANPYYHRLDLIVDPGMTTKHAIIACTTGPVKPARLIKRKMAEVKFEEPFLRNEYLAGVDARHDAVLTSYQLMYGSTGT